jgi:hypothetical protein
LLEICVEVVAMDKACKYFKEKICHHLDRKSEKCLLDIGECPVVENGITKLIEYNKCPFCGGRLVHVGAGVVQCADCGALSDCLPENINDTVITWNDATNNIDELTSHILLEMKHATGVSRGTIVKTPWYGLGLLNTPIYNIYVVYCGDPSGVAFLHTILPLSVGVWDLTADEPRHLTEEEAHTPYWVGKKS